MKIQKFLEAHYENDNSRKCIGFHLTHLNTFLEERDISLVDLTAEEWKEYTNGRGWGYLTKKQARAVLGTYSAHEGLELDDLLEDIKLKKKNQPPQRYATQKKVDVMLDSCNLKADAGIRDHALVSFVWDTWVRRSEVPLVEVSRMDLDRLEVVCFIPKLSDADHEEWQLKALDISSVPSLNRYLKVRARVMQRHGKTHDYLFINIFTGDPLTKEGVSGIFKRIQKKVGFKVSPHDLRRGGASDHAEHDGSFRVGMLQGGWSDPDQYLHYTEHASLNQLKDRRNHDD